MDEDTIVAVEVQETEYGETLALQSPFEAKGFIKVMPWKTMEEEIQEHGSLKEKAVSRGMGEDNVAIKAAEDFGFSDGFATHASWEPNAFGKEDGAWTIDPEAWTEAAEYFKHCGFDVENRTDL